jgi:hypothetical protein
MALSAIVLSLTKSICPSLSNTSELISYIVSILFVIGDMPCHTSGGTVFCKMSGRWLLYLSFEEKLLLLYVLNLLRYQVLQAST